LGTTGISFADEHDFFHDFSDYLLSASDFFSVRYDDQLSNQLDPVVIERLASSFPYPIKSESRRKKSQRFLALPRLSLPFL
jgi:hypothetical protein